MHTTVGADRGTADVAGGFAGRGYRHDWVLFADWCAAVDLAPLPAAPSTLASFLSENPAAAGTQRRRVTAINWVHDQSPLPAPGRAIAIRCALDAHRARRLGQVKAAALQRIPEIPVTGWPQGLFGRRDACLLILASAGMPFERISRLRRGDLTVEHDALVVAGPDQLRLGPHPDPDLSPAIIYRRWDSVLAFVDRHPSTRAPASRLAAPEDGPGIDAGAHQSPASDREGPVFTSIDRWGYLPLHPHPLTAASVADIVRGHLTGRVRPHTIPAKCPPRPAARQGYDAALDPATAAPARLGEYYDHGTASRRSALADLREVGALLDDVESRAELLLEQTLTIVENWQVGTAIGGIF